MLLCSRHHHHTLRLSSLQWPSVYSNPLAALTNMPDHPFAHLSLHQTHSTSSHGPHSLSHRLYLQHTPLLYLTYTPVYIQYLLYTLSPSHASLWFSLPTLLPHSTYEIRAHQLTLDPQHCSSDLIPPALPNRPPYPNTRPLPLPRLLISSPLFIILMTQTEREKMENGYFLARIEAPP